MHLTIRFLQYDLPLLLAGADYEWAVQLNRYSLELIGLWPKSRQSAREKLACNLRTFLVLVAIALVIVIPAVHSLIRIYKDFMLLIDNLQYTLPPITCMIRIMIFWWKKKGKCDGRQD